MTIHPLFARWPAVRLVLLGLPLVSLALACDNGAAVPNKPGSRSVPGSTSGIFPAAALPSFRVSIDQVRVNWGVAPQQTFSMTLTNTGARLETIHAIVYACNEDMNPPRRAISPPTASDWFVLAESQDGRLSPTDIEAHWKDNSFVSARGGKLKFSWDTTPGLPPGASRTIEASHDLDDVSPHPATRGKKLARSAFKEYQVWLFTSDGRCFHKETVPLTKVEEAPERPATRPAPTRPVTTKQPSDKGPVAEADAADLLRLAQYYLSNNKPDPAREKLQLIVEKYPQTEAARTARQLLREMRVN
jgi:hypothetical protein